jgi:glyoxylase-like metal-dependent hydrolase (beta-lactamase superfamily II)
LYALCFARGQFPTAYVMDRGSGQTRLGFYCFLWHRGARNVLVDSGFQHPPSQAPVRLDAYRSPAALLAELGVPPEAITDVVLTHGHWDHAGGLNLFPAAHVWVARAEVEAMQRAVSTARPFARGYTFVDWQTIQARPVKTLVESRADVTPDVHMMVVGGHTPGMATVLVDKHWALVGDNAYLYANLEPGRPISALSRVAHAADALPAIRALVGDAMLVPGHDPTLMQRFPSVAQDVVELR